MNRVQQKRERRNLRAKVKRRELRKLGEPTWTKIRKQYEQATGVARAVLGRMLRGTLATSWLRQLKEKSA